MTKVRAGKDLDVVQVGFVRDVAEIANFAGPNYVLYLCVIWLWADERWTITYNGRIVGLFGVSFNTPWLVGNDGLERVGKTLVKEGRKFVKNWKEKYEELTVYTRNNIPWLKLIGFEEVGEAEISGKTYKIMR